MLTSQKVINAINEQIGYEFSASLQYYAIAAHFAAEALPQLSQHFFKLARKANDYITINFLQWFLTEQLEEVSSMDHLLKIIERAGDDLLQADEYLARVGVRAIPDPAK